MSGDFDYRKIDNLLHSRIRLAIMSILFHEEEADFVSLRKSTKATDGNLTVHLRKLEEADYITVEKKFVDRKPLTLCALTPKGRKAFHDYIKQLESFISSKD